MSKKKFTVTRTSDFFREKPPCPEAIKIGEESGWLKKMTLWEIELSFDGLLELTAKHGRIVLEDLGPGLFQIEIYDDDRE